MACFAAYLVLSTKRLQDRQDAQLSDLRTRTDTVIDRLNKERDTLMLEVMGRLDDLIRHNEVPRQPQGSDTARITGSIEKALERVLAKKDDEGEG